MPSKYVKKGGNGGARPGAGHPGGSQVLGQGERAAIRASKRRLPADATDQERLVAGRCLERMLEVMEGEVFADSAQVLKAATRLREEICGPLAQKLEHTGKDGSPLSVNINIDLGEEDDGQS